MTHSAASTNIHGVKAVRFEHFTPGNANCVSFQIQTETGWHDMALFFENDLEAAKSLADALKEMGYDK